MPRSSTTECGEFLFPASVPVLRPRSRRQIVPMHRSRRIAANSIQICGCSRREFLIRFEGRSPHSDNYEIQRSLQNMLRICRWLSGPKRGRLMHPRRFTRVRPTGRISDGAKLIIDPKARVVDCRIVDYSPGGACLEISLQTELPNRFELLFGGTRKRCRVVWTAGRRLGVAF